MILSGGFVVDDSNIIEQLFIVITELDARDSSNNCVNMQEFSWNELCDMGINLFNQLKNNYER